MNARAIELGWRLRRGTMMASIFVLGLVAFVVVMSAPILLIGGLAGVLFCGASRWKGSGTAHGTARWATLSDLYRRGLVGGHHGLILGRVGYAAPPSRGQALHALFNAPRARAEEVCRLVSAAFSNRRRPDPSLIRLKRFVHLATFAPTGRGKSVSVLIPNLLSWHGPVVVTDPKGELFRITGKRRVDRFGHRAICLDPFGAAGGKDSFNPLDLIDPESRFVIDRARDLANAMIVRTGEEKDPHWNDSAKMVLTTFIAFVVCHAEPGERHLQTVRELLTNPEAYRGTIDLMRQSGACAGMLKRLGDQLTRYVEKELASVLTTVNRHLAFLDSPAVADVTGTTFFDPAALLQGRASIYLVLPPDQLRALAGLMRLWVTGLLRFVTMQGESERQPVLFLLDEAGHLGRCMARAPPEGCPPRGLAESCGSQRPRHLHTAGRSADDGSDAKSSPPSPRPHCARRTVVERTAATGERPRTTSEVRHPAKPSCTRRPPMHREPETFAHAQPTANTAFAPEPLLIQAEELARMLGVSTRTLWRLLSAGRLPRPVRFGGNTRWRLAEVKAWIARGCPSVAPDEAQ